MILRLLFLAIVLPIAGLNGQTSLRDEVRDREEGRNDRSSRKNALQDEIRNRLKQTHERESSFMDSYPPSNPPSVNFMQESWVRYYGSGVLSAEDNSDAIALDNSGNVYVSGSSTSATSLDFVTQKYDPTGVQVWSVRYDGGKDDDVEAIAVDATGNVYVTGWSNGTGSSSDFITVKYNHLGVEQWASRYNGTGNRRDRATAIAVDNAGNVIVTGYSAGNGSLNDYVTIKYDQAGNELWTIRYNGPGISDDSPTAIALDQSGNICITGASYDAPADADYATVKYSPDGVEQWVQRYENGEHAYDIAVDVSGNVYITGSGNGFTGSGNGDYVTIKYDPSGNEQWVSSYNGPANFGDEARAIAIDLSGNICVTGRSYGINNGEDYATVKYSSTGQVLWVARYNGAGNYHDMATSVATDASNNVYVTGWSSAPNSTDIVTIKYDSSGIEEWTYQYDGPDGQSDTEASLVVDGFGNTYVTGTSESAASSEDFVTMKYQPNGNQQWVSPYNGTGNSYEKAMALTADADGNVYVTGHSNGYDNPFGNNFDYSTIKYDVLGNLQWEARYDGPAHDADMPEDIAVDAFGNVYVTGESDSILGYGDFTTVKYNSSGVQQWVARYDGPSHSFDGATAIALDATGNVYVTGHSNGGSTSGDFTTIKYSNAGVEEWVARYDGPASLYDDPTAIAVDGSGNVYVTGSSRDSTTYDDYATVKYNASGIEQWAMRYNHSSNGPDDPVDIAVTSDGKVYVTGSSRRTVFPDYDYATIKYGSDGTEEWVARYNGPASNLDDASGLAVDDSGNVYVTGSSYHGGFGADYATVKYSPAGSILWVSRYNGGITGGSEDRAQGIALDSENNAYVTGWSSNSSGAGWDYTTVRYNNGGIQEGVGRVDGPGNESDYAVGTAVDGLGNVYVTGYSVRSRGAVIAVIKYGQDALSVGEEETTPSSLELYQNYPNPFNPNTMLRYALPTRAHVTLKIYNLLGQEVATIVDEIQESGYKSVVWNSSNNVGASVGSGVYFCRLQAGDFVQTRKMVLVK